MASKLLGSVLALLLLLPVACAFLPPPMPLIAMIIFGVAIVIGCFCLAALLHREEQGWCNFVHTQKPELDEKQVKARAREIMRSLTSN